MTLLQTLISGLLLGGIYSLISMGLNLILGVVRIINFAHGELLMIAMYISFLFYSTMGLDPYVSAILVIACLFLLGIITQRFLIQPILDTPASTKIFATLGLSIALQNLALMTLSADHFSVRTSYQSDVINIGELAISIPRLIAFIVAISVAVLLYLFLKKTMTGKAIRAVAMQRQAAYLMGVNVKKIYLLAFGIGSALVGLAGAMLMPIYSVYPTLGTTFVLIAFVVVVLGGMGSMFGAFFGGLIIGLVEALSGVLLDTGLKEAVYFAIFILVLLFRPSGIFSLGKGAEEVGLK
ncbi:branched-chain amino acid ABC transporter permease [Peribacillus glennii]|uniref:Branched-chain amino acid ABC transporter permease n=1 Tax=Peribacillus glennii TaxID=2303991 RepID=A0A372LES7_9BACI|nr:branched-chain amino acid ABC transporter permease [Peribacillus glennii]RFU64823.1 branched-chain amino acid ABC transporter permease [Peribacillus glennii]